MSIELTMPRLSDTMEQGTIIKWNVKEGDKVASGAAVADVETDKATMEMQSFDDGILAKILVPAGKLVPIGTVIALIAEPGEDPRTVAAGAADAPSAKQSAATPPPAQSSAQSSARANTHPTGASSPSPGNAVNSAPATKPTAPTAPSGAANGAESDHGMRVSPVARRIAEEHKVDLAAIRGSGPGGRIVKDDVLAAVERGASGAPAQAPRLQPSTAESRPVVGAVAAAPAPATAGAPAENLPALGSVIPLSGIRLTIAKRLVESKTTIPHYQVSMRFDMDPLLSLRETLNRQLESQGVKLSVNDFLVRACAIAMHRHPEFNASWAGSDGVKVHERVNVGIAISLPRERGGGLVVGVVRDADRKGLRQLSEESKALSAKARSRGLSAEELSDSTFTISNLGMFGVEHFTAIINPPNSAILAVGAALEQPVVRGGQVVVGHEMIATLSLDHRVIDGAMAAEYLRTLKGMIEGPAALLV